METEQGQVQPQLIIQANDPGIKAIHALADVALRSGGMQNLNGVQHILNSVKPIPPQGEMGRIKLPAEG